MKDNSKNPIQIPEELSEQLSAPQNAVIDYLQKNPHSLTHHIRRDVGVLNLPDCVMRMRDKLAKQGLMIVNYLPEERLKTRYGAPFKVHKWALVEMDSRERVA